MQSRNIRVRFDWRTRMQENPQRLLRYGLSAAAVSVFIVSFALALHLSNALVYLAGLCIAVGLLFLIWHLRLRYLLFVLAAYLPFQDGVVDLFRAGVTIARVAPDAMLFAAVLIRVLFAFRRRERIMRTPLDLPLAFLLLVAIASAVLNAIPFTQAIQGPYTMLRYATVWYLAASSRFTRSEVTWFLRCLIGIGLFEALLTVAQFLFRLPTDSLPHGTMDSPNTLGILLGLICVIVLAGDIAGMRLLPRWLNLGFYLFGSLAITVALSREGWMTLALGALVIVALQLVPRSSRLAAPLLVRLRMLVGPVASGLAGASLAVLSVKASVAGAGTRLVAGVPQSFGWNVAWMLGGTGTEYGRQLTYKVAQTQSLGGGLFNTNFYYNSRLYEIANAGPAILHRSPVFGLGPGTFGSQPTFHDQAFYSRLHVGLLLSDPKLTFVADVGWMNVFGQLGLLGIAGFIAVLFVIARLGYECWRDGEDPLLKTLGAACAAFALIFFIVPWFGPNLELRPTSILLWFLPGLVLSLRRNLPRVAANPGDVGGDAVAARGATSAGAGKGTTARGDAR